MTYAAKCTSSAFHIRRRAARDFKRAYVSISFSETYFDRETAKDASVKKNSHNNSRKPLKSRKRPPLKNSKFYLASCVSIFGNFFLATSPDAKPIRCF